MARGATSSHSKDIQPSFAVNSVCIFFPSTKMSWLVAPSTVEEQRSFLDGLCSAGCIMSDLTDHFSLLAHGLPALRLGRPKTSRRVPAAETVALKVAFDDERKAQLLDEVKVLMSLKHDGIVGAGGLYLVNAGDSQALGMLLDYKKRGDLASWIPGGGLPEWIVRGIMGPICDALVYLHRIPAVHRDIKPSNVLCERAEDGSVKLVLADFGLASHALDAENMARRCGTGGFIAPEMFRPAPRALGQN